MKQAFLLLLLFPLAALAQQPATSPLARIESIHTSVGDGEVLVDIETSAPLDAPGFVTPYADELVWDIPGMTIGQLGQRFQINKADVRDVRVWMQQQRPPIVRLFVAMNRDKAYALTTKGNHLILHIGPGVQTAAHRNRGTPSKQEPITVIPAGRSSRSVANTLGAVFTREQKRPVPLSRTESASRAPESGETHAPLPPIQIDEIAAKPVEARRDVTTAASVVATPAGEPAAKRNETLPSPPPDTSSVKAAAQPEIPPAAPSATSGLAPALPPATSLPAAAVPAVVAVKPPAESTAPISSPKAPVASTVSSAEFPAPISPASAPAVEVDATPAPAEETAVLSAAISPAEASPEVVVAGVASPEPAAAALAAAPPVPNAGIRMTFHVKFVQQDTAYIDGGRTAGLTEGMKLLVSAPDADGGLPKGVSPDTAVAEVVVVGIAETSAVTEIHRPKRDVVPGDLAYFTDTDVQSLVQQRSRSATRKYPVVISFTEEDDALDAEARIVDVPRPPLPSVNRMQGRFGFDYIGTQNLGSAQSSGKDVGIVARVDFTRIGGTYWDFRGYWRGRVDFLSTDTQPTLQELINRTYHLALTYDNPTGHWVAGAGRLLIPWAGSLDTLDGGYFGRRVRPGIIVAVFGGSTPDPTSWNYNPNREIGGAFLNFSGGSFDAVRFSSTAGAAENMLNWKSDRPMAFFENTVSYRRNFSVFHSLQADSPAGNAATAAPGPGIGRSFLTVRWSPISRLELDLNHTYFRDVPTFDPILVGTGLLDKYLFQGFSAGGRVGIVKQISVYTQLGRSNRSGDSASALNRMYGVTWGRVPWLAARADVHYSRFNSSFGSGSYRAVSFTRNFRENLRLDVLGGTQAFTSTLAGNQTAKFVTTTVDSNLGSLLFVEGSFTVYRGQQQNYNQWMLMMGYRFDSKWRRR